MFQLQYVFLWIKSFNSIPDHSDSGENTGGINSTPLKTTLTVYNNLPTSKRCAYVHGDTYWYAYIAAQMLICLSHFTLIMHHARCFLMTICIIYKPCGLYIYRL